MFKSNLDEFFNQSESQVNKGLDEIGRMLKTETFDATPWRTGNLASRTNYRVSEKVLTMYNDAHYASYVELGTIFQVAQPFMRETLYKNLSKITEIITRNLKV